MAIEVNITKQLNDYPLHIKFDSEDGKIGILGASGCGKSMTLKCIAGIEMPDEGRIVVNGKVLYDSERHINVRPQERNIGYLFQNYALFPTMTVRENIAVGMEKNLKHAESVVESLDHKNEQNKSSILGRLLNRDGMKKVKVERINALLNKLSITELADRYPAELSGGQQQRVALARILAYEPDMILLDEPFSALDSFLKENLMRELKDMLSDYKGQVIVVSHSRDEIYSLCHSLLIMNQGQILRQGETKQVFHNPEIYEAARLTGCKNISPIEKIGEHEIYAKNWNVTLHTDEIVLDEYRYVGIRAHEIVPVYQSTIGQNIFPLEVVDQSEAPFEIWYMIRQADDETRNQNKNAQMDNQKTNLKKDNLLWWKISKQLNEDVFANGIPQMFRIPEKSLLLLK